jgi:hypothetical protein
MGPEESHAVKAVGHKRRSLRRLALLLLVLSFPTFILGTGFVLIAWIISAAAFLLLMRDPSTRRAAAGAFVLLLVCVFSALLLDGGIRGIPRMNPSPEVQRVAGAMGGSAMWFAAALFVHLAPLAAPRRLQGVGSIMGLGGFVIASALVLLGEPRLPDVGRGTLFGISFILSIVGSGLVAIALLWEVAGIRPRANRRKPAPGESDAA